MEKEVINVTIEKTIFKENCKICGQEIMGTSESQVLYNLETHMRAKHAIVPSSKKQK